MGAHYLPSHYILTREVHGVGYIISIGLKVVLKTFNLGEGGGYITGAWQVHLGLHTIFLHDGVYCGLHSKAAQCKSYYTPAHTIYHNQCTEYWNHHFRLHFLQDMWPLLILRSFLIIPYLLMDYLILNITSCSWPYRCWQPTRKHHPRCKQGFNATRLCWTVRESYEI